MLGVGPLCSVLRTGGAIAGNWFWINGFVDCSEVLLLHLVVDQRLYRVLTGTVGNVAVATGFGPCSKFESGCLMHSNMSD